MLAGVLTFLAPGPAFSASGSLNADLARLLKTIPAQRVNSESRQKALEALALIGQNRLKEGSQLMNAALQLDPANSYLQFFNALSYHMMGQRGDRQMFGLAEQGYALAVQFDRSNWIAHYFLGLLHFEQRNFVAAKRALAEVLLFREDDQEVLFRLVAASYYAGDPVTAAACLDRLRKLSPADPQILRLSAIISAAIGQAVEAEQWLAQYQASNPAATDLSRARERVRNWNALHLQHPKTAAKSSLLAAAGETISAPLPGKARLMKVQDDEGVSQNTPPAAAQNLARGAGAGARPQANARARPSSGEEEDEDQPQQGGPMRGGQAYYNGGESRGYGQSGGMGAPLADCSSSSMQSGGGRGGYNDEDGGGYGMGQSSGASGATSPPPAARRMVLVDVVIMRTEDSINNRFGLNLLSALTLQFGSSSAPGFSRSFTSTTELETATASTILTRAINLPALTYSLNMVNSNANLNEVLARPTLAALEGVKSEFFSGTTLNAAVVSSGSNGGGSVQIEKEIGVKLCILPTFVEDNKIRLSVNAQRTFLKPPSPDVAFTYKVEVSKIMVNANVVMKFGETLVLGGLSEKETTNLRDGVPVLQDVPLMQYLFARREKSDFQRSVLMLITPRTPQYAYRSDEAMRAEARENGDADSMNELRARYGDWFKPYPNLASVFNHMNLSSLYREFRTGDVTLEKWDKQSTATERLQQALDFLLF